MGAVGIENGRSKLVPTGSSSEHVTEMTLPFVAIETNAGSALTCCSVVGHAFVVELAKRPKMLCKTNSQFYFRKL